jgi:hypothetical protein
MASSLAKRLARNLVKPVLQQATAPIYRNRPLSSWPSIFGRIQQINVPRGVVPYPTSEPACGTNINNLTYLIEETRSIPGDTAECGTFRGESLIPMGVYIKQQGISKRIYAFDSFEGFAPSILEDLRLAALMRSGRSRGFSVTPPTTWWPARPSVFA